MDAEITFLIFTYNEARRIEYVLRCFQPYGRIVVMDNYSTDNTAEIAKKYGADVHLHRHNGYVEEESVANNALAKVKTDWVYWAFADEVLPHSLLRKLQDVAKEDRYRMVIIPRKNIHYGMKTLTLASGASPRFFKNGAVDFKDNPIHGMGRFTGATEEVLRLPERDEYSMYHCSTYNLRKFELAHSAYSDTESRQGGRFSPVRMLLYPVYFFLRYYVLRGEWRNGWAAFVITMQYCFFFFNVEAKRWEIENGVTLETIEMDYDRIKEEILARR